MGRWEKDGKGSSIFDLSKIAKRPITQTKRKKKIDENAQTSFQIPNPPFYATNLINAPLKTFYGPSMNSRLGAKILR